MVGLCDVTLPCGDIFDENDFRVYSRYYQKYPRTIRALQLEIPVKVKTLEGIMRGDIGDWLVRGIEGEFYVVKDYIFQQSYHEVDNEKENS